MSGFLRHIAARGMGQTGVVHSAARLSFAPPPALAETAGETGAPPASAQSLAHGTPAQDTIQAPMAARPDAAPGWFPGRGSTTAAPRPPAPLLRGPAMLAPASRDAATRDDRSAAEAAEEIDAARPLRRGADSPISIIAHPSVAAAAHGAEAAPAGDDEGSAPLRRIPPLLPPQQGAKGTAAFNAASGAQGSAWRTPVEETTEVHVSIGRIEVTAVHEAAPAPKRAPARGQRAMSLEDYLARRKAGRS